MTAFLWIALLTVTPGADMALGTRTALAGGNALAYCLMLAGIHIAMGIAWLVFYASALEQLSAALGAARLRRRLQALTGAALLGLGPRLAFAERGR